MKYNQKAIGAILYIYYLENYCENDFSFDNGELRNTIEKYYINLNIPDEEYDEIENNISVYENEGTDYDYMEFRYNDMPELFLQVTALIDYDNNPVDGYNDTDLWADVGIFFLDYKNVEFDDLED